MQRYLRILTSIMLGLCTATMTLAVSPQSAPTEPSKNMLKSRVNEPMDPLDANAKQQIIQRIAWIGERDQQFRGYLAYGTTDEAKIAAIKKMSADEQLAAMSKGRDGLSEEVKSLLRQLQRTNDQKNLEEFISIINEFGYPSPERIGQKTDKLFALLLHPAVDVDEIEQHIAMLSELLLPEVKAGRMRPRSFAMFVDNMHGKILQRGQVYGTNETFDRATRKILPPPIESLEKANRARREIGMPALKEGEYRIFQSKG